MTTRRDFLKVGVATAIAGTAVATGLPMFGAKNAEAAISMAHPFGYPVEGLNTELAAEYGYKGYTKNLSPMGGTGHGCAHAVFTAIIGYLATLQLVDGSGAPVANPYAGIPKNMMNWGAGGSGIGTLCGALNGAFAAFGLITTDNGELIKELTTWYSESMLPEYAPVVDPARPTTALDIPQSIAGTELCHASVTNWCRMSGVNVADASRGERCARLSGDVAAKAVELLNAKFVSGTFVMAGATPGQKTTCYACHNQTVKDASGNYRTYDQGGFVKSEQGCTVCHSDLKRVSARGHHNSDK
ncbi:MAG: C-GCAxxG-C-C family (seleno)protein [Desulfobulbaceae bacterium]